MKNSIISLVVWTCLTATLGSGAQAQTSSPPPRTFALSGERLLAGLSVSEEAVALVLYRTAMGMAAIFFSSIYSTYADSFSIPGVRLA